MEAVGARMGRTSSRYGTTTVFSGPVRKWKKDWVPITPSSSSSSSSSSSNNSNHHLLHLQSPFSTISNGGSFNGNNGSVSRLRLFKWMPVSHSSNKDDSLTNNRSSNHDNVIDNDISKGDRSPIKDSNNDDTASLEPPRKKFKYIPIAMLEKQTKGAEDNSDDEATPADTDENTAGKALKRDDEKPDINDIPMEENGAIKGDQRAAGQGRQDLNESLDLSLGWTSHEEGNGSDSQTDPTEDG